VNNFLFYLMNSSGYYKPLTIVLQFRRDGVGVMWRLIDNMMITYRSTNNIIMPADPFPVVSLSEYLSTL
jgi:hypothetical protein